MVEFALGPALAAGFVGTLAMTAVMMAGRAMGMTSMDMPLMIGGMMSDDEGKARRLGMTIHVLMMGTVVFGVLYGFLFAAFDSDAALTGLSIGVVHGLIFGLMVLPMMPAIHPRMKASASGFQLDAPGVLGVGYGKGTAVGIVMAHAVYGLVVALVFKGLA